eukprot:8527642-Alexandrium_andersonii.AAC.1
MPRSSAGPHPVQVRTAASWSSSHSPLRQPRRRCSAGAAAVGARSPATAGGQGRGGPSGGLAGQAEWVARMRRWPLLMSPAWPAHSSGSRSSPTSCSASRRPRSW